MSRRPLLALLLLPTLLLAGCVSTASDAAPLSDLDANAAARRAGESPGASAPLEPAARQVHELQLEGRTAAAAYACVATPASFLCEGGAVPMGDARTSFPQRLDGALAAADLVLTWESSSPATDELLLGLTFERDGEVEFVVAYGPSPVTLREDALDVPEGSAVAVYVWTPCQGELVVAVCATTPVDFRVQGTLTTHAPAPHAS